VTLYRQIGGAKVLVMADRADRITGGIADQGPAEDSVLDDMLRVFDEQTAALRRTAIGLYEKRQGSVPEDSNPVELLVSDAAMRSRFEAMNKQVRRGFRSLVQPPYVQAPEEVLDREVEMLRSGIRVQVIMGPEMLDDPAVLSATMETIKAGEETRILPAVPMRMRIVDSDSALIALPGSPVHLFVHRSPLLDGLIALFGALWRVATPLPQSIDRTARGNARIAGDRAVLTLLAAGATDAAIARHLDISLRTAQRRISEIMAALGAETRFQAGIQAARRGWL
jgi:DNA-binding CsgD family transcriptional regulator